MKHCVITGAATGIGKALAERFAEAGYAITGIDKDAEEAQRTQIALAHTDAEVSFIVADLRNEHDVDRIIETLRNGRPIDVFVHNAAINIIGRFADSDIDRQQEVIDVNLLAPMLLTPALLRDDMLAEPATLVFISSLSHHVSFPGAAVYGGTKDGIAAYARSLSVALADRAVTVLTVFPGPTQTAHARRYSPDNMREEDLMPPQRLADAVYAAVQARRHVLIPGWSNTLFALVGRFAPGLAERMVRRTILDRLGPPR